MTFDEAFEIIKEQINKIIVDLNKKNERLKKIEERLDGLEKINQARILGKINQLDF